jgi:phosphatidate cytidylyltransferase
VSGKALKNNKNSDLPLRLASALVLGTVVLAITWYGGVYFRVLIGIAALLIYREWSTITASGQSPMTVNIGWLFVLLGAVAIVFGYDREAMVICAIAAIGLGVLGVVINGKVWASAGTVYSLAPTIALALIRDGQSGLIMIFLLFAIVWATDIGAYFAGRSIGGPKLAPAISPKKTWSGFLGGLFSAVIVAIILLNYFGTSGIFASVLAVGTVACILSVLSQLGDLFESWIKRRFDVKDSGQLIPGHGGIMDRVDGLVVAAVAFYGLLMVSPY